MARKKKAEEIGKTCPACQRKVDGFTNGAGAGNSHSRYVDAYICSGCGTTEAFKGFFWSAHCPPNLIEASARRRKMSVRDLVSM
jgi:hypothetical protein